MILKKPSQTKKHAKGETKMHKKAKTNALVWIIVAVVILAAAGVINIGDLGKIFKTTSGDEDDTTIIFKEQGQGTTAYFQGYTGPWGKKSSKTAVGPVWTILNKDGNIIVDDTATNSTTKTFVGDELTIYPTGSSYYGDVTTFPITQENPTKEIKVQDVVATTNLVITCYDDTETTALTADNNDNNTADYAGGDLGADETYTYYCKLKNNVADKTFRVGAILTYYCGGEVDDYELTEGGWTEVSIPSGKLQDTFTHYDDDNQSTSCSFKHAYVPDSGDYVELQEWEWIKYQFTIDTDDSTGPTANGDSYVGAVFVDYACEKSSLGEIVCDWYKHDSNNDPGDVGIDEAAETTGYKGLDVGYAIEPQ